MNNYKQEFKNYMRENFGKILVEFDLPDDKISRVNEELSEYVKTLTNFNNINLSQVKSILNRNGLIMTSDGIEIEDEVITLTDSENTISYAIGDLTEVSPTEGEQDRYEAADNARISFRRNQDENGNISLNISIS